MKKLHFSKVPAGQGALVIASLPGRGGDVAGDLAQFAALSPDLVVTMVTDAELAVVGLSDMENAVATMQSRWVHMPVQDYGAPAAEQAADWTRICAEACDILQTGGCVIVHCKGGCGRSGMVVLRLMIALGEAPEAALARLRAQRPCAVETQEQMRWALEG